MVSLQTKHTLAELQFISYSHSLNFLITDRKKDALYIIGTECKSTTTNMKQIGLFLPATLFIGPIQPFVSAVFKTMFCARTTEHITHQ